MNRIIGILVFIILAAGTIWYGIYLSTATEAEITQKEIPVENVNTDIVDQTVLERLDALEQNGKLPVTVSPEELGKSTPFTP